MWKSPKTSVLSQAVPVGTRISDRPVPLCSQFFKRQMWNACLPLSDECRRPSSSTIYFGHPSSTKVASPRGPLPLCMGQIPASLSLSVASPLLSLTLSPAYHSSKYISYPLPSPKLFKAFGFLVSGTHPHPTQPHPTPDWGKDNSASTSVFLSKALTSLLLWNALAAFLLPATQPQNKGQTKEDGQCGLCPLMAKTTAHSCPTSNVKAPPPHRLTPST